MKSIIINHITTRKELSLLIPLYLFIVLSGFTAHVPLVKIVKLLIALLLIYFLPGYLLLIYAKISINPIIRVFLAFSLGYSINVFLYLLALMLGLQKHTIIIAIIYIFTLFVSVGLKSKCIGESRIQNDQDEVLSLSQEMFWVIGVFLCTYIVAYFTYQSNNLSAQITGYLNQHQDNTVWFRNTVSALKRYPVPRLSTKGVDLYYHLFSSFQLAFLHFITGIEIFDLCFSFSYVWNFFLLVGGVYWFFSELLNNRFHIRLGTVIVLFTTGTLTGLTSVFYINHLYLVSFGFIEGFSISFYAISCIFHLLKKQDFSRKRWAISLLLFATALGGKAPCGCIVLVGAITACVWMIRKGNWKPGFSVSFSYILTFCVEYLILFYKPYNIYTANSNARMGFSFIKTLTDRNMYYIKYDSFLTNHLHNSLLSAVILACIFLIMTNFIMNYYILFSLSVKIRNIVNRGEKKFFDNIFELITWAMLMASYCCFIFFWQDGYSQVYFAFIALPYGILISFYYLEKYKPRTHLYSSIHCIGLVLTGVGITLSLQCISPYIIKGAKNLLGISYESDSIGSSVTRDEVEAMTWVKHNTNENAILITNKLFCDYMGTHSFITSAYTERQLYLEGYAYESLNDKELEKRLNLIANYYQGNKNSEIPLKEQGIDYAILFKDIEGYNCPIGGNAVFENNGIRVIKLSK